MRRPLMFLWMRSSSWRSWRLGGFAAGAAGCAALEAAPGPDEEIAATAAEVLSAGLPDRGDAAPGAGGCHGQSLSSLSGVAIAVRGPCTFTLAQARAGLIIPYEVQISASIDDVVPRPLDAGRCSRPGPSGMILFEELKGNGQRYCLCDRGLCVPPRLQPHSLAPGAYAAAFAWDGRNWLGPSDTKNGKGAPFPSGAYQLHIRAAGTVAGAPFAVHATYPLFLTP